MAETLAKSVDSLRIHDSGDNDREDIFDKNNISQNFSTISSVNSDAERSVDLKERNARDYFDETSFSVANVLPYKKGSSKSDIKAISQYINHSDSEEDDMDFSHAYNGEYGSNRKTTDEDDQNSHSKNRYSYGEISQSEKSFSNGLTGHSRSSSLGKIPSRSNSRLGLHELISDNNASNVSTGVSHHKSHSFSNDEDAGHLYVPSKTRFVRSNGSPYGSRTFSERSILGPSLSPIQGSEDEDDDDDDDDNKNTNKKEKEDDILAPSPAGSSTQNYKSNRLSLKNSIPTSKWRPKSTSSLDTISAASSRLIPRSASSDKIEEAEHPRYYEEKRYDTDSPFDNVEEVLSKGRLASSSSSSSIPSSRVPSRKISNVKDDSPSAFLSFNGDTIVGFRAKESEKRKLETENLELRMKLQQYREMNTSETEMVKMKNELSRAEKRIDELELALERKNRVIEELTNEKDNMRFEIDKVATERDEQQARADELYSVIEELQRMISDLEQADKKLLSHAHKEFPDILPENPDISDLLNALRNTVEENSTLTSVSALASSLKAQSNQIMSAIRDSGRKGDPVQVIREFSADVASLRRKEQDLVQMLNKSEFTRHELEQAVVRLEETSKEAKSLSYSLIQNFFAELFDIMGDDFQSTVELELKQIVERSIKESVSKIPPLSALMVSYTRKIAEMAVNNKAVAAQEQKIAILEGQNQSLEHLIELKMDKVRADNVLRAQIRDLQRQVKRLNELRQTEWKEYERALKNSQ